MKYAKVKMSDITNSIAMVAKRQAEYELVCEERSKLRAENTRLRRVLQKYADGWQGEDLAKGVLGR